MAGFCEEAMTLETEIHDLQQTYTNCKVIKDIGEFKYIITIRNEDFALQITFQIEEAYPHVLPGIVLKDKCLDASDIQILRAILDNAAKQKSGNPMLKLLAQEAFEWVKCREYSLTDQPESQKKKISKSKKRSTEVTEKVDNKLPSMKTAEDVINRIIWDDNLPTDCFTVGYLDRFTGITEKPFAEFSWEDIASVDYDTLAIPKHRIQYFKYKNVIVWDKTKRLDNFFGSVGGDMKINDVIESHREANGCEEVGAGLGDSDQSDDEDVVVHTGSTQLTKTGPYPRDEYWGEKLRPTHFLCLRVSSPQVVAAMEDVQRRILERDSSYADSLIPTDKLHVTLACLGLDSDSEIDRAADWLKHTHAHIESFRPRDIELSFRGVDNFFHKVLYAKLQPNEEFMKFVSKLRVLIKQEGIEIRDVFDFQPHMTILKFKKHHQAMARTRFIDTFLYDMFAEQDFGEQSFDNIHLCKMTTEADVDGFYICPRKITFSNRLT